FLYIILSIADLVAAGQEGGRLRRAAAAFLPLAILVFIIASDQREQDGLAALMSQTTRWGRWIMGLAMGLLLLEIGQFASRRNNDLAASLYALFLSFLGVFILFCLVYSILFAIHDLLLGLVVAGSLDIIFRGPPQVGVEKMAALAN